MKGISGLLMKKVSGFSLVESLAVLLLISMMVMGFVSYATTKKFSVQNRCQEFYGEMEKTDKAVEEELAECN